MKLGAIGTFKTNWLLGLISISLAAPAQSQVQTEFATARDEDFCTGLGLSWGSSAHRECVLNVTKAAANRSATPPAETPRTIKNDTMPSPLPGEFCSGLGLSRGSSAHQECVLNVAKAAANRSVTTPAASPNTFTGNYGISSTPAPEKPQRVRSSVPVQAYTKPQPNVTALSPHEQSCIGYGFKRGTNQFAQCLMQLDQAQQQAQFAQQQYQLQLAQYQQQQAAYEAQQAAIKKERDRRKWSALATFGFGMAATNSPTFSGGLADGMRALNGQPPLPAPIAPAPPVPQNYTLRLPNGNQVYCYYSGNYMSCR